LCSRVLGLFAGVAQKSRSHFVSTISLEISCVVCCTTSRACLLPHWTGPPLRHSSAAKGSNATACVGSSCASKFDLLNCIIFLLFHFVLQSSAPHVQAHGVCALFPAFLLFVGRFAGSIIWTKVPFSRDIDAWRQDNVVLLQNSRTTNWFVAACEISEAASLLSEIKNCLDIISTATSQPRTSATFDAFSPSTLLQRTAISATQLGKSLDSTRFTRRATHVQPNAQGGVGSAAITESLLFGEHRCRRNHVSSFEVDRQR
jgi:hypothetical protein